LAASLRGCEGFAAKQSVASNAIKKKRAIMHGKTSLIVFAAVLLSGTQIYAEGNATAGKTEFENKMRVLPLDRAWKGELRTVAGWRRRAAVRHAAGFQLYARDGQRRLRSKRRDSRYASGRTANWTKCRKRETFIVAGIACKGKKFDGVYSRSRR
jgi:hypothetical protein